MPRPDKRFVRYPRQGATEEPEAGDAARTDSPPSTVVKGRHMVVPRGAAPVPVADDPTPTPSPRHPVPGERISKYESRPTSGAIPTPDRPVEPAAAEPAAAARIEKEPMEVVFDLRESDGGFEATYWKREVDQPAAEGDQR